MADDIGWFNIGSIIRASCPAVRLTSISLQPKACDLPTTTPKRAARPGALNFITGQLPIRTGLTTVGQAGAKSACRPKAPTIATALKSMGYATGQFGKNHLGDLNEYLPTLHGFDEFFGYLYHLDAMEDPAHPNYPQGA